MKEIKILRYFKLSRLYALKSKSLHRCNMQIRRLPDLIVAIFVFATHMCKFAYMKLSPCLNVLELLVFSGLVFRTQEVLYIRIQTD